jgi:protocatechuate 3,4-dioxygenase beta subunit
MRPALVRIAAVVLIGASSYAQNSAESQNKCSIAGSVVDAKSQQPLRGVSVSARAIQASASSSEAASVISDGDGRFSFDHLVPGQYLLSASYPGYINPGRGVRARLIELLPTQHLNDIEIDLTPESSISGQILSAKGKVLAGTTIQALTRLYRGGTAEFRIVASAVSDKTGAYQLTALPPANYYLRAIPGRQHDNDLRPGFAYVPAYFPAAPGPSGATGLVLQAGDELAGIDIILNAAHTVVVKGRIIDAQTKLPARDAELTLIEEGSLAPSPYQATVDGKGNFELSGVPPGNYVLTAQSFGRSEKDSMLWGQKPLQVQGVNLQNVELRVYPGVEVRGHISVAGEVNVDLSRLVGVLQWDRNSSARGVTPAIENASVDADGSFVFRDVPDGTYRINFFPIPTGFYLKTAQSLDILEHGVTISHEQPSQALELVLSPGAARIEGTVLLDQQASAGAVVVLVPDAERRGQLRYYRQTRTDRAGRFVLQNIIPGDYEIIASQQLERGVYTDPEFLQQFDGQGKAVSLKDGASVSLQLDAVSPK